MSASRWLFRKRDGGKIRCGERAVGDKVMARRPRGGAGKHTQAHKGLPHTHLGSALPVHHSRGTAWVWRSCVRVSVSSVRRFGGG